MPLRSKVGIPSMNEVENNGSAEVVFSHLWCYNAQSRILTHQLPETPKFHRCSRQSSPSVSPPVLQMNDSEFVIGRENEISILKRSILQWISERSSGCIYVSGGPGTGKTVTVAQVVQCLTTEKRCRSLFLNCMSMSSPRVVYTRILEILGRKSISKGAFVMEKIIPCVEAQLTKISKRLPLVLVLDEVDQLASRCQDVFYTVFGWSESLKDAHLILIGIANALDLSERLLSNLQEHSLRPTHIVFPPYSMDQIVKIVCSRLVNVASGIFQPALDNIAVQFCAKKVAASSGDVRIALAVCRRALELARLEARPADGADLKVTYETTITGRTVTPLQKRIMSSPSVRTSLRKRCALEESSVESEENLAIPMVRHISQAIQEVQSGGSVVTSRGACVSASGGMPLHHKLVLAACLLLRRLRGIKETSMGQVFDVYVYVCAQRGNLSPLQMDEFVSVCELLESHGLIHLVVGTGAAAISMPARQKRLSLLLDDKGVERSLNDDLLFSSILSIRTLPCCRKV